MDILVLYGDKYEVLNFQDLIEIGNNNSSLPDVRLKNLEYDIDKSIKKVVYGFQDVESIIATLDQEVTIKAYISS